VAVGGVKAVAKRVQKLELPADVASCASARRFVHVALAQESDDLRATASLLVSEVVANAVLHASGPLCVEVLQKGGAYRISVSDGSPTPPADKGYRRDDATGRGIQLLEHLAGAWGCKRSGTGKIVWFDLPGPFDEASPLRTKRRSSDDPYPDGVPIALIGAPIQEMIRTAAHYDALYREFRLILELDSSRMEAIPRRLLHLIDELGSSFLGVGRAVEETWDTAVEENRETVDLHFRLPSEAAPVVERYNQLLDEADDYCRRFELLTVAPTDEAVSVRGWAFGQIVSQCRGKAPRPWSRMYH
jgi:anti-sigma regulatory factor (Ser/Thr protein kinase)